ncbi:hypothetical protein [Mangrovibacterium lignilyticum]|uniref:hypothetical protein n=1 Tax=Mangrovibacterium lignilyticum TaxID=2668052 RepID=UPI0013D21D3B|nr:hypothetical protein [Mangrovibacterium lignilyticum]
MAVKSRFPIWGGGFLSDCYSESSQRFEQHLSKGYNQDDDTARRAPQNDPSTAIRSNQNTADFDDHKKPRVVPSKTTCGFTQNNVWFQHKQRVVFEKSSCASH